MAIGVLIKRVTKHGENAKVLLPHIIELRALAVRQPGYIWLYSEFPTSKQPLKSYKYCH